MHKDSNKKEYETNLERAQELNPNHNPSAYSLGQHKISQGKQEEGKKLLQGAFDRWQEKFEKNEMQSWDYSWFSSCAEALGKNDLAEYILECEPKLDTQKLYNSENLAQFKNETGLNKID